MKKFLLIFLTAAIIFGSIGFLGKPAYAVWGVGDINFDPTAFAEMLIEYGATIAEWVATDLAKGLRDAIAKRIMDYMVDQTIKWIQGGGKPQFVTDFSGFLKDSASAGIGDAVLQTNAAFICSPFKAQILLGLQPTPTFSNNVKCTLDGIVGNINNFYADFSKGGWVAYTEVMQPQNNYYGVALQVSANLNAKAAKAVDAASKEAQAGGGFLSVKRCKGGGISEQSLLQLSEMEADTYTKDFKGSYCPASQMENTTPGAIVGESVKTAINSDSQWAANIQSYSAALINALINRLFKEGLSAMSDSNSSSENSAAGYTAPYQGTINQNLENDRKMMADGITKFLNEWQYLSTQYSKALSSNSQVISALEEIKRRSCTISPINTGLDIDNITILTILNATSTDDAIAKSNIAQNNLTEKVNKFGILVQQANSAIIQINAIYSNYSTSTSASTSSSTAVNNVQLSEAQRIYLGFINKYNNQQYLDPLTTGSDRANADSEVTDKKYKAELAQKALIGCGGSSTNSTSTSP